MYTWNWNIIWQYKIVFLEGALVTLELTGVVILIGTALGALLASLEKSGNVTLSVLSRVYIEMFRALPILVVLIWIFYVVPVLWNWNTSPFSTAVMALSLNLSAFVAETFRAALDSVPRSQLESGLALGMSRRQATMHIVVPQAVRNMIPNLLGLYITEMKNSSLASIIAVNEILHRANILISNTFRPLEIYTVVAMTYLIIILPFIWLSRFAERRCAKGSASPFSLNHEIGY